MTKIAMIAAMLGATLAGCATDAEMAERRIQMEQEMVGVRARRAAIMQTLAQPEIGAAVGQVIGCALVGGCPAPAPVRPTMECRASSSTSNGKPIYKCE